MLEVSNPIIWRVKKAFVEEGLEIALNGKNGSRIYKRRLDGDGEAQMEQVLDVYKRPYDPEYPVVCMDEMPRQLIDEIANPIPTKPGRMERHDYEYKRNGICDVFIANEPLGG